MATKEKPSTAKKGEAGTTVTRITATDTKASVKKAKDTPKQAKQAPVERSTGKTGIGRIAIPFIAIGNYFRGAWYELRQVRWPNRKATWSLTAAVLGFTAFFVALILLLDALFKYVFQLILG